MKILYWKSQFPRASQSYIHVYMEHHWPKGLFICVWTKVGKQPSNLRQQKQTKVRRFAHVFIDVAFTVSLD